MVMCPDGNDCPFGKHCINDGCQLWDDTLDQDGD